MGQKVHPNGIRLGISKSSDAHWYDGYKHSFAKKLNQDLQVRAYLEDKLKNASISRIVIQRPGNVTIYSSRPGVIIGKRGSDVEVLRSHVSKIMGAPIQLTIHEEKTPDMNAKLVAENIAQQLERRVMFRRAMKRALQTTMRAGAEGIKVSLSGRLAGAEIARTEWSREGRVPLHTLRADIDYATARAQTTYGVIGVKVWIYKGEVHHLSDNSILSSEKPSKKEQERT